MTSILGSGELGSIVLGSLDAVAPYVHAMTPMSAINEYVGRANEPTWAAAGTEAAAIDYSGAATYAGDGTLV